MAQSDLWFRRISELLLKIAFQNALRLPPRGKQRQPIWFGGPIHAAAGKGWHESHH
jgi:hypothetical protein